MTILFCRRQRLFDFHPTMLLVVTNLLMMIQCRRHFRLTTALVAIVTNLGVVVNAFLISYDFLLTTILVITNLLMTILLCRRQRLFDFRFTTPLSSPTSS